MKQKIFFLFSLLVLIFSIPIFTSSADLKALDFNSLKDNFSSINFNFDKIKCSDEEIKENKDISEQNVFTVYDKSADKILSLTLKDFTYGAVVTEMPPTFEPEALKAQAVAAFTYYSNLKEKNQKKPDAALKGADFAVDSANWLYYVSKEQMKERWGENFDFYYDKLSQALNPILGQTLKQDGKFIEALYHSISSGNTECITDVFGGECSYLKAVPSPGDVLAPGYQSSKELSCEEFRNVIKNKHPNVTFPDDPQTLLQITDRTDSGMVLKAKVGSIDLTGRELRELFSLRSSNFEVNINNDNIIFSVKGYGHGVGMSQYGAQNMALEGADYKQILAWYYPNTELST